MSAAGSDAIQAQGLSMFGVPSFTKAPLVRPGGDWQADVGVLGVPFDQGTGYRSGARFGPKAVRDWSVRFSMMGSSEPGFFDMRTGTRRGACRIVDCGDVDILPLVWEQNFDRISEAVTRILEHRAVPLVLGGDHAITFPVLRAYAHGAYRGDAPITVVHLDAHADYRDDTAGVRYGHGHVLRRVRELDWVERVVSVGIRALRHRPDDIEAHRRDGNTLIHAWDVHRHGVDHFADALPRDATVYITFDIDAMDAAIAPGTGTPEVGGLTYEQARRVLELVCGHNRVVGLDLVEVNPQYDPAQVTALLANHLLVETLGFLFPGEAVRTR